MFGERFDLSINCEKNTKEEKLKIEKEIQELENISKEDKIVLDKTIDLEKIGRRIKYIESLLKRREKLIEKAYADYWSDEETKKTIDELKKVGEEIYNQAKFLSDVMSGFHYNLYLIHYFLYELVDVLNDKNVEEYYIQMPVINHKYMIVKGHYKNFPKRILEILENIFFRGLYAFNKFVFAENHFYYSAGTIFMEGYWEDIKSCMDLELYSVVENIGYYLKKYFFTDEYSYDVITSILIKYIKLELKEFEMVDIEIKEVGFDKTQYRMFEIERDVNCDYGSKYY